SPTWTARAAPRSCWPRCWTTPSCSRPWRPAPSRPTPPDAKARGPIQRTRGERTMATDAATQQESALKDVAYEGSDFGSLLQKEFKPRSDEARSAVESAVLTLAQQALANTQVIGKDVTKSIQAMIAAIDAKLTEQINLIIHNEDYQKLESAWRGLH